ncbi:ABC transporter substrate-binding protein [Gorillibacterium sp. CAU 1737]|uniref:ABC transporter substrate-binding protein n=1 Tax=Gorillibacterium sp. CAU 1737 TaxID=3140362 RepID=UPI0032613B52
MRMKKIAMPLLLIAAMLAGCGKTSAPADSAASVKPTETAAGEQPTSSATSQDEKVELTFYYPIAVGGPLTATIEGMAEEFTKQHPNIVVKPVYTGSYSDTTIKAQAGVQGKNPPDVAVLLSTELYSLLDMDAVIPLDDYIAQEDASYLTDFYPAFMANSQTEGKTYSIPFQRSTIVLYYNKDMFKEAGLDPEKAPQTWDELAQYATKLTKEARWGLEIPVSGFSYWMFQTFALQNGKNLMSEDGKQVFFDTPENVEALQYWTDLAGKHKATPTGVTDWATVPSDFIQGKTAMMYHTTGNLTNVKKNAKFNFGVSFLPQKKTFGSPTGGGNFYIFKDIDKKKQDAAWKFIKFMTETERAAAWSRDTGYVAVRKSAYETETMKAYIADFPAAQVARDQLEVAAAELSTHNNGKVTKALSDNLQAVLTGSMDAQTALKKAQEEATAALAPFNK